MDSAEKRSSEKLPGGYFQTTHWSVVLAAGQSDSPVASEALEILCRIYWYPLYAFVRREGHDPETAKDLIQAFFARLLTRRDLEGLRRENGRFRSYLLAALKHFLANEWHRANAQKRGGGRELIPLDQVLAEKRYDLEPADPMTPERIFEKRWALSLLDQVLARLRDEEAAEGRLRQFVRLQPFLTGADTQTTQAAVAAELGTSEGAIKQRLLRLRQRYRELVRAEVAQTVATAGEVEAELRHLIAVLRG